MRKQVGIISAIALAATLTGIYTLTPPPADQSVMVLRQHVHDLAEEFSALEVQRFVPPKPFFNDDGSVTFPAADAYSLQLESAAHKLEDCSKMFLELPLFDLATARTRRDRQKAGKAVRYGVDQVRSIINIELAGAMFEYNEADVMVRFRGALVQIESLADVPKTRQTYPFR